MSYCELWLGGWWGGWVEECLLKDTVVLLPHRDRRRRRLGWVGGWVVEEKGEESKAVRMSCWTLYGVGAHVDGGIDDVSGWVVGWLGGWVT